MMLGRTIEARCVVRSGSAGPALDDPLAHRLGERVAVGPAEAAGPLGADPDQLVLDPLLAGGLGGAGGGEQAGPAVLLLRLLALLGRAASAPRERSSTARRWPSPQASSVLEVDVVLDRRLGDAAPAPAGDVRRGDVHVVDVPAALPGASSIRSSRSRTPITLVVNPSSTGGSNETSPAQCTTASRSVGSGGYVGQVALDDRDPGRHQRLDAAGGLDDLGEDRLLEQLGDPVRAGGRPLGPDQHRHADVGHLGQHAGAAAPRPRSPVTPVSRTCWPASRSATEPCHERNPATSHRHDRDERPVSRQVLQRLPAGQPGQPVAEPVHLGAHPVGVGAGVLAQRPADRLAQPERRVVEVGLDGVAQQVEVGRRPGGRPGRSRRYAAATGPRRSAQPAHHRGRPPGGAPSTSPTRCVPPRRPRPTRRP